MMKYEEKLRQVLAERGLTFAAAESCTGGLIAKRITDVPGASGVFMGGVVSYTNEVKMRLLGVPSSLLDEYGAVSPEVAKAMCEGVQRATGAAYGASVTGVAGPDKDDRGNEVGTVFVGITDGTNTQVHDLHLSGSREDIRQAAADYVFTALTRLAENQ